MNAAIIELARILLQFEVERIERQQKAAANGGMDSEAHKPAATAERRMTKITQPKDSTPMPGNHKKNGDKRP